MKKIQSKDPITKAERLDMLFKRAQMVLSNEQFHSWLCYCFGIFEYVAGANRRINRMDVTLIAMELKEMELKEKEGK